MIHKTEIQVEAANDGESSMHSLALCEMAGLLGADGKRALPLLKNLVENSKVVSVRDAATAAIRKIGG